MNEKQQADSTGHPPKWAVKLLNWYCDPDLVEEIDGDLYETFEENKRLYGLLTARRRYAIDVIRFIQPFTLKTKKEQLTPNHLAMLKNYIVVAYRSLIKKIGFSMINIFGLSVGITCCLLIMMYVQYETSYDNFQQNGENIYRIALDRSYPDRQMEYAIVPHSYPPQLVADYPEVLNYTNFFSTAVGGFSVNFRNGAQVFDEPRVLFADTNFFEIVTAKFIAGDPSDALKGPNRLVLTESTAKRYFGNEDPLGKSLQTAIFGNGQLASWEVTGIVEDYPKNSHLEFDIITSTTGIPFLQNPNWMAFSVTSYVELSDGTNPQFVNERFPEMIKKYAEGQIKQATGQSYEEYTEAGHGYHYFLQPIQDIHLASNRQGEITPNSNWSFVYMLISIAIFILVIACINFMNLATARSDERAKEVGLRKVMGSLRKFLVYQFLTESILLSVLSTILAVVMSVLLLPYFNNLTGISLSISNLINPLSIIIISVVALLIGLLAGFYPAFVLSSFAPVAVLKGKLQNSKGGRLLRNGLVTFQFIISISLISATLIIFDQMEYVSTKSLGFESDNMMVIDNVNPLGNRGEVFRQELIKNENIVSASYSGSIPGDFHPGFITQVPGVKETPIIQSSVIDEYYLETMNIQLIEGRNFSRQFNDSLSVLINETAASVMGFDQPLGKRIGNQNPNNPEEIIYYTIVGVISDYHFESLHNEINPLAFLHPSSAVALQGGGGLPNKLLVKFKGVEAQSVLSLTENQWKDFQPDSPFKYYFLDSRLAEFYNAEKTAGRIFTIFTVLAIIIACVGLFGLAAYTASLKTKEIGVRKVLGASVTGIMILLSKEFTKLVLIAIVFAIPITYLGMDSWLEDFAFRININPISFIISALIAMAISWATISFQSFKAAIVNPVKSLRSE